MESNKLTVEEFARKNLGKSFITFDKNHTNVPFGVEAMIVGYNHYFDLIICSMTECSGWNHFWNEEEVLLLHSPLNYSYFYMDHHELIARNLL